MGGGQPRFGSYTQSASSFPEGSSDDSYLSADEEPEEAPTFEKPLEDATATRGSVAILTCIITGSPTPTGNNTKKIFHYFIFAFFFSFKLY